MASSALVSSVSKPAACSLHQGVNAGKGLPEFSGLRSTNACLPFSTKTNDDFFSLISFQTSGVGGKGYKGGVTEAKLKVAINGFGRIGRNFLRCWHGREGSPLEVIAINDTGGVKQASHLLKYDSTLGIFDADVKPVRDNAISVDGKIIEVVSSRNPLDLPWKDLEVGLVIEGTGVFVDREGAEKHIQAGAKKVLITAPGKGDIPTYVVGVNADAYTHEENIISNASCITNCLAPFVKVLDQKFDEVLLPSGRDASKRREVLFSTFGYLAGVLWHDRLADVAVSSEFADMPALRGKDYGKSKMRYPDYTETKSGLQYKDLRLGDGPIPKMGEIVVVDWDGYTIGYYGRIFEARNKTKGGSFEGGEKEFFKFKLGSQEVIPAFEEAVAGMAPGGIRRIIVPPELGYPENDYNKKGPQPTTFSGQRALDFVLKNQGLIDKTLLFDIELLKVVTNG